MNGKISDPKIFEELSGQDWTHQVPMIRHIKALCTTSYAWIINMYSSAVWQAGTYIPTCIAKWMVKCAFSSRESYPSNSLRNTIYSVVWVWSLAPPCPCSGQLLSVCTPKWSTSAAFRGANLEDWGFFLQYDSQPNPTLALHWQILPFAIIPDTAATPSFCGTRLTAQEMASTALVAAGGRTSTGAGKLVVWAVWRRIRVGWGTNHISRGLGAGEGGAWQHTEILFPLPGPDQRVLWTYAS